MGTPGLLIFRQDERSDHPATKEWIRCLGRRQSFWGKATFPVTMTKKKEPRQGMPGLLEANDAVAPVFLAILSRNQIREGGDDYREEDEEHQADKLAYIGRERDLEGMLSTSERSSVGMPKLQKQVLPFESNLKWQNLIMYS